VIITSRTNAIHHEMINNKSRNQPSAIMTKQRPNKRDVAKQARVDPKLSNLGSRQGYSTAKQFKSSMNSFEKFLELYNSQQDDPDKQIAAKLDDLTEEMMTKNLVGCYADYLCKAKHMFSTAKSYFSALFRQLKDKFQDSHLCNNNGALSDKEYTQLAEKIRKDFEFDTAENRVALVNHHIPITKDGHHTVCEYLFETNRVEDRAIQSLDYQAAGRASELHGLRWSDLSAFWSRYNDKAHVNCMKVQWYRGKTSDLTGSSITSHQILLKKDNTFLLNH
jgi:hypothetical protein